jgi:hypothetical protein
MLHEYKPDNLNIYNELEAILGQTNGFAYNWHRDTKVKKRFPDTAKPVIEQINDIRKTSKRRCSTVKIFNDIPNLLDLLYFQYKRKFDDFLTNSPYTNHSKLRKYVGDETTEICNRAFIKGYYDTVYLIDTENPHLYINKYDKWVCDTIVVACSGKTFNIMYELNTGVESCSVLVDAIEDSWM